MESEQFDRISRAAAGQRSRRGVVRLLVGAMLGAGAIGLADAPSAASHRKKHHHHHRPQDRCTNVGICGQQPPSCGKTAPGTEDCTCQPTTEGANACINFQPTCDGLLPCKNTKECRQKVGFHFFCQTAQQDAQGRPCGCGQVCVTECDNPNPA